MGFIKPNLFVSSCIEQKSCRYDSSMISFPPFRQLKEYVNIYTVCPETSIGLSVPREALRLVEKGEEVKLVANKTLKDYTQNMTKFSTDYLEKLKKNEIDGFILKAKSPSCGVFDVEYYYENGNVSSGRNNGIFGGLVLKNFPNVPVETERRLSNFNVRDVFYTKIFTLAEFREVRKKGMAELIDFHARYKYLFMTYNKYLLTIMGNIVANKEHLSFDNVCAAYYTQIIKLFNYGPTIGLRITVIEHIYGYFKKFLSTEEKKYFFIKVNEFKQNQIPFMSLLDFCYGYTVRFRQLYLVNQKIFQPYPRELITMLDSGKTI